MLMFKSEAPRCIANNHTAVFLEKLDAQIKPKYGQLVPKVGFNILRTSIKKVMTKKSPPAVILLIGSSEGVLNCLAKDLMDAISEAYCDIPAPKPYSLNHRTGYDAIADEFVKNFNESNFHSVAFLNLEKMSSTNLMAFHRYTDHESATYQSAIIILTAVYQDSYPSEASQIGLDSHPKHMDQVASRFFELNWKDTLQEDLAGPINSRLTSSVVALVSNATADGENITC